MLGQISGVPGRLGWRETDEANRAFVTLSSVLWLVLRHHLHYRLHHALDANSVQATEINRTFAEETR